MLDEEGQQPDFVVLDLGELFGDGVGYEVGAAGARGEREGFLVPGGMISGGIVLGGMELGIGERRWEGSGG